MHIFALLCNISQPILKIYINILLVFVNFSVIMQLDFCFRGCARILRFCAAFLKQLSDSKTSIFPSTKTVHL